MSAFCKKISFLSIIISLPAYMTVTSIKEESFLPLGISCENLRLSTTLLSGQSFRWIETAENEYSISINEMLLTLKETNTDVLYMVHSNPLNNNPKQTIEKYFRMDIDLPELYKLWSKDPNFSQKAKNVIGLRLLNQGINFQFNRDPVENIFSFICSSNNNISRIKSMVLNLCKIFGKKMGTLNGIDIYSFPKIENLVLNDIEPTLRQLGFGYRAGYIAKSAKYLNDNPLFLIDLQQSENIKQSLMNLSG
jgi:N-glycosylase/DNA lyase